VWKEKQQEKELLKKAKESLKQSMNSSPRKEEGELVLE